MLKYSKQMMLLLYVILSSLVAWGNHIGDAGRWDSQVFVRGSKGTPFFNETYKYATVRMKQGRKLENTRVKLDLVTQELIVEVANGIETNLSAGMISELSYADTTASGIIFYTFKTGFPAVDKQNGKNFYLVLSEGRCSLVKAVVKKTIERRNELSGEVVKEFESTEQTYLFTKGEMKILKKDKDFILSVLADKKTELNQYLSEHVTNFRNQEHIIRLLNYYNSL